MNEEQEMEAEALEAIFDTHFQRDKSDEWTIEIYPEMSGDGDDENANNHVGCRLTVKLNMEYPESSLPTFDIEIIKGLAIEHVQLLHDMALEEAQVNEGVPCIFAVCEKLREWLMDNNVKGLDDRSMYSQMIRKQQEQKSKEEKAASTAFEAQSRQEDMTQAELEELAVRKRREEGTPCTKENFEAWKEAFEKEMSERAALEEKMDNDGNIGGGGGASGKKGKEKKVDKSGRLTGYQLFSNTASMNLEALEAAAEEAGQRERNDSDSEDEDEDDDRGVAAGDVDEELFMEEDDVDLDDLDFDDEDDEDEEDVDI